MSLEEAYATFYEELPVYVCEDEEIRGTNLPLVLYSTALEEFFIVKPSPIAT